MNKLVQRKLINNTPKVDDKVHRYMGHKVTGKRIVPIVYVNSLNEIKHATVGGKTTIVAGVVKVIELGLC